MNKLHKLPRVVEKFMLIMCINVYFLKKSE
jgi:hypothetical protein